MSTPTRLFDFIYYQNENFPQARSIVYRHQGKEISYYSTQNIIDESWQLAYALHLKGLTKGDMVASVAVHNRPEWIILDLALQQIGVVNVPVYPTISTADYIYIFNETAVKMCFIGDDSAKTLMEKVRAAQKNVPSLKDIYTFDKTPENLYWEQLRENINFDLNAKAIINKISDSISENDLATIIYTSGTTGEPKGVMLSHKNIVSNIKAVASDVPMIKAGDKSLSFLPLNHALERAMAYTYIYLGMNVYFTGVDNLGGDKGDLKTVKPHFFASVPRLLEKVYERIYNKGLELKGVKKKLFFWALNQTVDFEYGIKYSGLRAIKIRIADLVVFSKWREALGGNIKGVCVGSSPCPINIIKVFSAAGVLVIEGYGLTEMSSVVSFNRFDNKNALIGTVGCAIDGVTIAIDNREGNYNESEGEIICAGDNVMMGYYKKPEETARTIFFKDGKRWLVTGDIGKMVFHKGVEYLKITDRKKELLKTSTGKYVAPAPIENKLKESFLIDHVMVVGDNKKFIAALITPAVDALKNWCAENHITWVGLKEILKDERIVKLYQSIITSCNHTLGHTEQIKQFLLLPDSWEATKSDNSIPELTPTMKIKRRVILNKYAKEIEDLYENPISKIIL